MGVTLFFLEKKSDDLFQSSPRKVMTFFSCHLLTTPIFPRRLFSVLSKFSHKKLILVACHPLGGGHQGRSAPVIS